ncbi:hypothetical protein CRG98_027795 [Punica granatum]|uniref:Uncharacterized protein n=1 Tax=Punica granatum TaxID=22663 RepID=A0A2I0J6I0_PUNGR|nr:hypothetical protein CRG98_027795 [Punica granatum]
MDSRRGHSPSIVSPATITPPLSKADPEIKQRWAINSMCPATISNNPTAARGRPDGGVAVWMAQPPARYHMWGKDRYRVSDSSSNHLFKCIHSCFSYFAQLITMDPCACLQASWTG